MFQLLSGALYPGALFPVGDAQQHKAEEEEYGHQAHGYVDGAPANFTAAMTAEPMKLAPLEKMS